jgi:hypothetical protein
MNDDPKKLVDLEPHKWQSEREKPREPFFGSGAGPLIGQLVIGLGAVALMLLFLWSVGYLKSQAIEVLFGRPTASEPPMQPGEERVINGVKVKRID